MLTVGGAADRASDPTRTAFEAWYEVADRRVNPAAIPAYLGAGRIALRQSLRSCASAARSVSSFLAKQKRITFWSKASP